MNWVELGVQEDVIAWLEAAALDRYAKEQRLDPFATSMRDFDDVSPDLTMLRAGAPLGRKDEAQRLTDLKGAGLVSEDKGALTELGHNTLAAWEKYGVANTEKTDELARCLLLLIEAHNLKSELYVHYQQYWKNLRTFLKPLQLVNRWNVLFLLSYLDYVRDNFAPGNIYREEGSQIDDIAYDLVDFANSAGNAQAVEGARRIKTAIEGKIPRGRHRATFCMAMEIMESGGGAIPNILNTFGFPNEPARWTPFTTAQKTTIRQIVKDADALISKFALTPSVPEGVIAEQLVPDIGKSKNLELPKDIDFTKTDVAIPVGKEKKEPNPDRVKSGGKVDGQQKARSNEAIGRLAEEFALQRERWRLRDHPELLAKIKHVSNDNDSLGYDIESFNADGTPRFIEVKGTLGPLNTRFYISANELEVAQKLKQQYVILRVGSLASSPVCCEIPYDFEQTLILSPSVYTVEFAPKKAED